MTTYVVEIATRDEEGSLCYHEVIADADGTVEAIAFALSFVGEGEEVDYVGILEVLS